MKPPDYTQYSIDELKQALNSIDKVAFPARTKQIEEEIISRINNPQWVKKEIKTKKIEYDISLISNSLEKSHFIFFLLDNERIYQDDATMEIAIRPVFFMWVFYLASIYVVIHLTKGYNNNSYELLEYLILMILAIVFVVGARSYHRVVVIDKTNKTVQTLNLIFGFSFLKKEINFNDKLNLIFYRLTTPDGIKYYIYLYSH